MVEASFLPAEQLRNDLLILISDIHLAKSRLGLCTSPVPSPLPSPTKHTTASSPPSPTRPGRFSKLTSKLRRTRSKRSQGQAYHQRQETSVLSQPNATRRGSNETDSTLLDRASPSCILSVLAPLVASLQGYGQAVSKLSKNEKLHELFSDTARQLVVLIEDLQLSSRLDHGTDPHDAGMRALLLEALVKKVQAELVTIQHPAPSIVNPHIKGASISPLVPSSRNPFILHANSLSTSSSRPRSTAKPIVPLEHTAIGAGSYTSFAAMGQSSWRMNVHRLGSFQASMLFSPSPVAVRRGIP